MPNKKKVLYIVTKSVWGGAQKYVYDLATNLPKEKFDVVVVTGGNGPLVEKLKEKQIRVVSLYGVTKNVSFWQEAGTFFSLLKTLAEEKPDIIHLNSSKMGGLGALAALVYKLITPHQNLRFGTGHALNFKLLTVFTAHGWPFNEDRNLIAKNIIYFFSWLTALFANRVINITKADYKQALSFPLLKRDKFIYFPNGINPSDKRFLPRTEARKFLGLGKEFVIGTIAELTKNKGLVYLTNAVNQIKFKVKNLKLKVIIIGDGEDREKIQDKITSLDLRDTIYLAGFIQDAEKYLKGFDIFALPSIKEGLPYTVMEAMAAGLPIIASDVGGIPDLIENGKSGLLVKAGDSADLADGLKKLVENHEISNALGKEAKVKIRTNFRFRDMLIKTLHLYE